MENNNNQTNETYDDNVVEFNITEWFNFFWSNRLFFILILTVSLIIGVIVALVLPKKYTAIATILPPQSSNSNNIAAQLGNIMGDFSIGGIEMNKLYPDIASSRNVLMKVLNSQYNGESFLTVLIEEYNFNVKKEYDESILIGKLIKHFRKHINTSVDRQTSLVTLQVTSHDPELSAELTNEILNQMDIYLRYNLKTVATGQSQMLEKRLNDISDSLRIAEDILLQFRERNRTKNTSPKLHMIEMQYLREVEVNSIVYIELTKQLEITRIQESQLRPVLNILDSATPPIEKSGPPRKMIVLLFMAAGGLGAIGYIKFTSLYKKIAS